MLDGLARFRDKYNPISNAEQTDLEGYLSDTIYEVQTYWLQGIKDKLPEDCLYTYMLNINQPMSLFDIIIAVETIWCNLTRKDIKDMLITDGRFKEIGYNIWALQEWEAYAEVETNFKNTIAEVKTRFTRRNWHIFYMYKVAPRRYTYEEIGDIYGITRERVRQITKQGIRKFKHPSYTRKFDYYRQLLFEELSRYKIILLDQLNTTYFDIFKDHNPTEIINILNTIKDDFIIVNEKYILRTGHFNLIKAFLEQIIEQVPEGHIGEYHIMDILRILDIDTDMGRHMLIEIIQSNNKFFYNHKNDIVYYTSTNITKADVAYIALKEIGKPVHYTEIGEKYMELTGDFTNKRLVLSYLDRHDGIVRVFTGIYGLKEWGCEEHTGLLELAIEVLEENQKIMHYMDIYEYIQDRTMAKPSSLISLISADDRFIIPNSGYVGLSKWLDDNR